MRSLRYRQGRHVSSWLPMFTLVMLGATNAFAAPSAPAPPLPAPSGAVVRVTTEPQLQAALANLTSGTTILVAPGTYVLTSTLYIGNRGPLSNVALRGETNDRDDVQLVGPGMSNPSFGAVPHGIWVGGAVNGVLIANLTIREVYYHPIMLNAGTAAPRIYNVRAMNGGELAKSLFGCTVAINPGSRPSISIPSADLAVSAFG